MTLEEKFFHEKPTQIMPRPTLRPPSDFADHPQLPPRQRGTIPDAGPGFTDTYPSSRAPAPSRAPSAQEDFLSRYSSRREANSATNNYGGRRQPSTGEMKFRLSNVRRIGAYVTGDVLWDADLTRAMSGGNIQHAIISFVKGASTRKENMDLGDIGKVRVASLDTHAGLATVFFASTKDHVFPQTFLEADKGVTP